MTDELTVEEAINPNIEEVIKHFSGMCFPSDMSPSTLKAVAINNMVLTALRQMQERHKGCEYCTGEEKNRTLIDCPPFLSILISKNRNDTEGTAFNFCPNCGRLLSEDECETD